MAVQVVSLLPTSPHKGDMLAGIPNCIPPRGTATPQHLAILVSQVLSDTQQEVLRQMVPRSHALAEICSKALLPPEPVLGKSGVEGQLRAQSWSEDLGSAFPDMVDLVDNQGKRSCLTAWLILLVLCIIMITSYSLLVFYTVQEDENMLHDTENRFTLHPFMFFHPFCRVTMLL